MRAIAAGLLAITVVLSLPARAQESPHTPSLLLTPKLFRRLKRDRERQTVRWLDFEKRIQTVPASPERGFELALYYAITRDAGRGKEAVKWALGHPCEARQVSLVRDWAGELISPEQQQSIRSAACPVPTAPTTAATLRNQLFAAIASDDDIQGRFEASNKQILDEMHGPRASDPETIYAFAEYIMALRTATRVDLRLAEAQFFSLLPKEFLLNLKPNQVEQPSWMAHIAALVLVTLDPNLENSQFLQGWGMEDRHMLREGPGVAYEFLWADPYLPGIAYQNMDPWIYDPAGRLFARMDWGAEACWLRLSMKSQANENCANGVLDRPAVFGTLTLTPMTSPCLIVPRRTNRQTVILWRLKSNEALVYENDGRPTRAYADASGLWTVPIDTNGKVCLPARGKH